MDTSKYSTKFRNLVANSGKLIAAISFVVLACALGTGTAHARWHRHWHGYHGGPDYYYSPSPGYYSAPEPYQYYGPEPAPAPSGFGLFFGF
jgi:hypothetical protein